ncbi:hypothetical protein UY3_12942 [Chelonia mydas]|uniref:Uncharacterized protein n=1 Tax=Chelonia mydas TaxID=8469 RepID=M7B393_CHEMY|nr:hypothetical protein UY3_12942 [Chelonia mydas]
MALTRVGSFEAMQFIVCLFGKQCQAIECRISSSLSEPKEGDTRLGDQDGAKAACLPRARRLWPRLSIEDLYEGDGSRCHDPGDWQQCLADQHWYPRDRRLTLNKRCHSVKREREPKQSLAIEWEILHWHWTFVNRPDECSQDALLIEMAEAIVLAADSASSEAAAELRTSNRESEGSFSSSA